MLLVGTNLWGKLVAQEATDLHYWWSEISNMIKFGGIYTAVSNVFFLFVIIRINKTEILIKFASDPGSDRFLEIRVSVRTKSIPIVWIFFHIRSWEGKVTKGFGLLSVPIKIVRNSYKKESFGFLNLMKEIVFFFNHPWYVLGHTLSVKYQDFQVCSRIFFFTISFCCYFVTACMRPGILVIKKGNSYWKKHS